MVEKNTGVPIHFKVPVNNSCQSKHSCKLISLLASLFTYDSHKNDSCSCGQTERFIIAQVPSLQRSCMLLQMVDSFIEKICHNISKALCHCQCSVLYVSYENVTAENSLDK